MDNLSITYQHIADILSFETPISQLEKTLSEPSFDWDAIVVHGSKHLVLTTLYCRLKTKQLLQVLPEELVDYLEGITNINRNRNIRILNQVQTIAKILNEEDIDHVFLKGTALLASGYYEDNGERMVGDIDILVEKSRVYDAFNLLKSNGYNKTFGFAYDNKDFRHLDRLISDKELAAIELHTELFSKKHWSLMDMPSIIKSKQVLNKIAIPNTTDLSKHLMLSWQLNDKGHYYNAISFKSIYDLIVVMNKKEESSISSMLKLRYIQSYIALAKCYFKDFSHIRSNNYMKYIAFVHKCTMSSKYLKLAVFRIKYSLNFVTTRLYLIVTNRSYTKHIIKKVFSNHHEKDD